MSMIPDVLYAKRMMEILADDRRRLDTNPSHAAVVLWMVEEMRSAASRLKLDRDTSTSMLMAANSARQAAMESRRKERKLKKRRAA